MLVLRDANNIRYILGCRGIHFIKNQIKANLNNGSFNMNIYMSSRNNRLNPINSSDPKKKLTRIQNPPKPGF